jgi:hypothetical protein
MQQEKVIKITQMQLFATIGQGEAMHRKCKRLKPGGGQNYDSSSG